MNKNTVNTPAKFLTVINVLLVLALSLMSMAVCAAEAKFSPVVKGQVVQFGKGPIFIRDAVIRVVMSGPNDYKAETTYYAGQNIIWEINKTDDQAMPNGTYNYEITQSHRLRTRQNTPIDLEGRTSDVNRESGTLTIAAGRWVNPSAAENGTNRDQQILDDLVVQGSICAGLDCNNNESFDFDTLRLKENNVRIRFFDTSNSASFPSTDWELSANDTTNGGANKFSIVDLDRDNEIFAVQAAAPANSLFVDERGRVGFGTSAPLLDQHVLSGNTPATRFEQDGSGGFPSQTWDIGGNETEFFIRDSSNAQVPVRVQPGAPSDSLIVNSDGNVEIGGTLITNSPFNLPGISRSSLRGQNQLLSLAQVEQHINRHQQLPGIDNQAQDLLLLQTQLLEKVQELTLYTIEQDKRIATLEAQIKGK